MQDHYSQEISYPIVERIPVQHEKLVKGGTVGMVRGKAEEITLGTLQATKRM